MVHNNNCGPAATDSQVITFTPAPDVTAGTYAPICFNEPNIQLRGQYTSTPGVTVTSTTWLRGDGTFSPNRNDPNAIYTPTAAERAAGFVELEFRVTTDLPPPCNTIPKLTTITIKPEVTVNSSPNLEICTGTSVAYVPTSPIAGATFAWTVTNSNNATGFSPTGTGNINDVLTNTSATANATVTYVITPSADGCTGTPFTLTVTVKPLPQLTTSGNKTICSRQSTAITLTSNLPNTTYTWTSIVQTGSITGNSSNSTATSSTAIDDNLFNTGTTTATVVYTITPTSAGNCPGPSQTVTITIEPEPTTANAGADEPICNATTYTLKGNQPNVGTGKWIQVTNFSGVTFSNDTQFDATVSGLQPGNTYIFRWTITGASVCGISSDEVSITVNPASVGGTTSGTPLTVCTGGSGQIALAGYVGTVVRWETSEDGGTTWNPILVTTDTYSFSNLAVTTQFRAVIQSGNCAEAFSTATTITVNPVTVQANAGQDQILCNATSTTLVGNDPGASTGQWTQTAGPAATITNAASPTTTVTGLVPGQTYEFTWTINGLNPCPATSDQVAITVLQQLANNTVTPPAATVCSNQSITIVGSTPTGGDGNYTYQWETSTNGGNTWTPVATNGTGKDLTFIITQQTFFRRIVTSGSCSSTSNQELVQVLPPIANNTVGPASQTICINTVPTQFLGSVPTGGDNTTYTYIWQSSPDNVTWTPIANATNQNYQAPALTVTTYFRRVVSTTTCSGAEANESASILVTVNPDARAEFTPGNTVSCAPFNLNQANIQIVPYADRNQSYEWFVNGVSAGTGAAPNYTITTTNTTVRVKLVARSRFGCQDSETAEVTYSTRNDVVASFTQTATQGCERTTITFTNTSTVIAGTTVEWLVDGIKRGDDVNSFTWTFDPNPTGEDQSYQVVLRITGSACGGSTSAPTPITIRTKPPVPYLDVDRQDGCSVLSVNFTINSTARASNRYRIDFGDGTAVQEFAYGATITHPYVNSTNDIRTFNALVTAVSDFCGVTPSSNIVPIRVLPSQINASLLFKNPSQNIVTAGEEVVFLNNTTGAISYLYKFSDGSPDEARNIPGAHEYPRVFNTPGTVTVTMIATSSCAGEDSDSKTVTVIARPVPNFSAVPASGCPGTTIQFRNSSTNAVTYVWDFGDGSPTSTAFEPFHRYMFPGRYPVKLTAYNSLGYPVEEIKDQFVVINALPGADFQVLPGNVIGVPEYTFRFSEVNPPGVGKSYQWDFGDDSGISTQRNPTHTYADTGEYRVKLIVTSEFGCTSETTQIVRITGVPSHLYVPNSFIPGGTSVPLQTFYAVGSGIASWRMQVFNKWGQVLWETTKLEDGKPAEGWDGTFKGTPQPQGVYFWKIDVTFINGTEWKGMSYGNSPAKRTGEIYLIR